MVTPPRGGLALTTELPRSPCRPAAECSPLARGEADDVSTRKRARVATDELPPDDLPLLPPLCPDEQYKLNPRELTLEVFSRITGQCRTIEDARYASPPDGWSYLCATGSSDLRLYRKSDGALFLPSQ